MTFLKNIFTRVVSFFRWLGGYAMRHKIQAGIAIVLIAAGGYFTYANIVANTVTTQYVLARTRIAPIQQTITGSGQVAAEHQLNLSPKTGGTLASVLVKPGDTVAAGQIVAEVDLTDADKTVRDAKANLASAQISYQQSIANTTDTTQKSRDAAFTSDASAFTDMGTVLQGINAIYTGDEVSGSFVQENGYAYATLLNNGAAVVSYRDKALAAYAAAHDAYVTSLTDYNATARDADPATIKTLTNETYNTLQKVAEASKDAQDYLNYVHQGLLDNHATLPAIMTTHLSSLTSYQSTMSADVNNVSSANSTLASSIQSSADGSTPLSVESAQLDLTKAQNAYRDALDGLENYIVRAPFAGTIASVPLQKFDQAGSGTTVAVLITKQQYATLSLNEVDAANVHAGQPATLTFDAITGLTINGTVAQIDTVGTVSQGVVSYSVKIGFDTQDPRVLPGMTVNATIITASNPAALVVPTSAVKTQGTQTYVEVAVPNAGSSLAGQMASSTRSGGMFRMGSSTAQFSASSSAAFAARASSSAARTGTAGAGLTIDTKDVTITRVPVTIGIASATMTEITSGLQPGQLVVSQSLSSTGKTTGQSKSILNIFGGGARTTTGAGATRAGATTGATGAARAGGGAGVGNAVFRGG